MEYLNLIVSPNRVYKSLFVLLFFFILLIVFMLVNSKKATAKTTNETNEVYLTKYDKNRYIEQVSVFKVLFDCKTDSVRILNGDQKSYILNSIRPIDRFFRYITSTGDFIYQKCSIGINTSNMINNTIL